jgi:hypothetical protein
MLYALAKIDMTLNFVENVIQGGCASKELENSVLK